jgi:hypothetical protein
MPNMEPAVVVATLGNGAGDNWMPSDGNLKPPETVPVSRAIG